MNEEKTAMEFSVHDRKKLCSTVHTGLFVEKRCLISIFKKIAETWRVATLEHYAKLDKADRHEFWKYILISYYDQPFVFAGLEP